MTVTYKPYKIQVQGGVSVPRWELNIRCENDTEAIKKAEDSIVSLAGMRGLMDVIVWDMTTEDVVARIKLKDPEVSTIIMNRKRLKNATS